MAERLSLVTAQGNFIILTSDPALLRRKFKKFYFRIAVY
jgi:hypothetical protein